MGTIVPIPMGIKDRAVYSSLLRIARSLARSTIISVKQTGTIPVADDLAIPNTPNYVLQESYQVVTGLSFEEFNSDTAMYQFTAGIVGDIGYTIGDPDLPSAYVDIKANSPSFGDADQNVILIMELYVRNIDSIQNSNIEWKIKKLE